MMKRGCYSQFLGEVESCGELIYLSISPFRTEGADFQMFPCIGGS